MLQESTVTETSFLHPQMNFNHGIYLQPSLAESSSFSVEIFGLNPNATQNISQNKAWSHLLSGGHRAILISVVSSWQPTAISKKNQNTSVNKIKRIELVTFPQPWLETKCSSLLFCFTLSCIEMPNKPLQNYKIASGKLCTFGKRYSAKYFISNQEPQENSSAKIKKNIYIFLRNICVQTGISLVRAQSAREKM